MTHEEYIAKAIEHATAQGISAEHLRDASVCEEALVRFSGSHPSHWAEVHLDSATGNLTGLAYTGEEFTPKEKRETRQFSKRTQAVLARASEESWQLGCKHIGGEHLLLALLCFATAPGAMLIYTPELETELVRKFLSETQTTAEAERGYAPSMRQALMRSEQQAETLGDDEIEPEHLLLALFDEVDGSASAVLRHFGFDVAKAKAELLQRLSAIEHCMAKDQFGARNGIELVSVAPGRAKAKMVLQPHHWNGLGSTHGGAIFTLADFTFAASSNSHGTVAVAINVSISFLKAVSTGTLWAEGRENTKGQRLATYTVEVKDDAGDLVAIFQGMVYRKNDPLPV